MELGKVYVDTSIDIRGVYREPTEIGYLVDHHGIICRVGHMSKERFVPASPLTDREEDRKYFQHGCLVVANRNAGNGDEEGIYYGEIYEVCEEQGRNLLVRHSDEEAMKDAIRYSFPKEYFTGLSY